MRFLGAVEAVKRPIDVSCHMTHMFELCACLSRSQWHAVRGSNAMTLHCYGNVTRTWVGRQEGSNPVIATQHPKQPTPNNMLRQTKVVKRWRFKKPTGILTGHGLSQRLCTCMQETPGGGYSH